MNYLIKRSNRQKWNIRNFQEKNQNKLKVLKSEGLSIQSIKKFAQELKIQKKSFKCLFCTEPYGYLLINKSIEGLM
ncbi:hypothetical protein ABFP31_07210 [Acinetobacter nosocomialis]|uniref:hypothetical protein n=1 Tax=Acinetobacter nosocomialis TaxID=106654 RepID=UPI0025A99BFC|nr:hypothetical protein [Acinetobacter nosocomialis]MDM9637666.1 hypothetical protein [Acinetobacter nosocomialis]